MTATVEEGVLDALAAALATITTGNGYEADVGEVYRYEAVPEEIPHALSIAFRTTRVVPDPRQSQNLTHKTLHLELRLLAMGHDSNEDQIIRLEADVEKAIGADDTLGGAALCSQLGDVNRHVFDPGLAQFAASAMQLEVQFRHAFDNPYTAVP